MAKFCPVKFCDAAELPSESITRICTIPLLSECAVQVTFAVTVVLAPCVTGFGDAVADEVKVGGAIGVAANGAESGLLPAEFVPDTTK